MSAPCFMCGSVLVDAIGGCARCYVNETKPATFANSAPQRPITLEALKAIAESVRRDVGTRESPFESTLRDTYRWKPVMDDRVRPEHRRAEPTRRPPVYVRPGSPAARATRFVSDRAAYLAQLRAQKPVAVARMEIT